MNRERAEQLLNTLAKSFFQGLLIIGPFAVTIWIIWYIVSSIDNIIPSISEQLYPGITFAIVIFGTALIGYMAGLAFQLAGTGIRANTVSPGNTYFDGGVWQGIESGSPEMFTESLALNPTGRMGTPQEVADVVVFVASPRASRVTGANILVDGGLSRGIQF